MGKGNNKISWDIKQGVNVCLIESHETIVSFSSTGWQQKNVPVLSEVKTQLESLKFLSSNTFVHNYWFNVQTWNYNIYQK